MSWVLTFNELRQTSVWELQPFILAVTWVSVLECWVRQLEQLWPELQSENTPWVFPRAPTFKRMASCCHGLGEHLLSALDTLLIGLLPVALLSIRSGPPTVLWSWQQSTGDRRIYCLCFALFVCLGYWGRGSFCLLTLVHPLSGSEPQEEILAPGAFPNGTVNQAVVPLLVSEPACSQSSGLGGHFPLWLYQKERTIFSKAYQNDGESQGTGRSMVGAGIESSRAKPSQLISY